MMMMVVEEKDYSDLIYNCYEYRSMDFSCNYIFVIFYFCCYIIR